MVSAVQASEAGSEYTLYGVEVTPSDGGAPWTVLHRFRCAPCHDVVLASCPLAENMCRVSMGCPWGSLQ